MQKKSKRRCHSLTPSGKRSARKRYEIALSQKKRDAATVKEDGVRHETSKTSFFLFSRQLGGGGGRPFFSYILSPLVVRFSLFCVSSPYSTFFSSSFVPLRTVSRLSSSRVWPTCLPTPRPPLFSLLGLLLFSLGRSFLSSYSWLMARCVRADTDIHVGKTATRTSLAEAKLLLTWGYWHVRQYSELVVCLSACMCRRAAIPSFHII